MTVDDFKSITKLIASIWQPLIEQGAIVFGPPGAARHDQQNLSTSDSSPEVPLTQGASLPDPSVDALPSQHLFIWHQPVSTFHPKVVWTH